MGSQLLQNLDDYSANFLVDKGIQRETVFHVLFFAMNEDCHFSRGLHHRNLNPRGLKVFICV
jgi:hypothetical protein